MAIDRLRSWSVDLSSDFGRQTKNPLLKGQNISEIVQFCINSYITVAFDTWRLLVDEGSDPLAMKQARATFRASMIHLLDVLTEALEAEGNGPVDTMIAIRISVLLKDLISTVDKLDYGCEFLGDKERNGQLRSAK